MRLNFNVLWVEDQPQRVTSSIKAIAKDMADHGFEFVPLMCTSIEEVQRRISEDVFTDEIDLILVDWDLGSAANGDKIQGQSAIASIRERIQYKDVIFYSANEATELQRLAFEAGVEGVYCTTRNDLVAEVSGVFESLIKKVVDLDHARGIVMGATSDIDDIVLGCLKEMHRRHDEQGKAEMLQEALGRVSDKLKEIGEQVEKLQNARSFVEILIAHAVFTANDRLRMLSRILEQQLFKDHLQYRPAVVKYIGDVLPHRNKMGHVVLVPEGQPAANDDESKAARMSLEKTREMRILLLELRAQFRSLFGALSRK